MFAGGVSFGFSREVPFRAQLKQWVVMFCLSAGCERTAVVRCVGSK